MSCRRRCRRPTAPGGDGQGWSAWWHPCKVYNLLQVGLPIVYIGVFPPNLGSRVATPGSACLLHGDVDGLVGQILRCAGSSGRENNGPFALGAAIRQGKPCSQFGWIGRRRGQGSFEFSIFNAYWGRKCGIFMPLACEFQDYGTCTFSIIAGANRLSIGQKPGDV